MTGFGDLGVWSSDDSIDSISVTDSIGFDARGVAMGWTCSTSAILEAPGSSDSQEGPRGSGRGAAVGTRGVLASLMSFAAGVDSVSPPNLDAFDSMAGSTFFAVTGVTTALGSVGRLPSLSDFDSIDLGWVAVDSVRGCCLLGTRHSSCLPLDVLLSPC